MDGGYFGGYVKPANVKQIAVIAACAEPERQAQSCRGYSRAWRRFPVRRFQLGKSSRFMIRARIAKGTVNACRRSSVMGRFT